MPTHWTIILALTCDRCGQFITVEGQSKIEALKMARADGWRIDAKTVCPQCNHDKENGHGVL